MKDKTWGPQLGRLAVVVSLLVFFVYAAGVDAQPADPSPSAAMARRFCDDEQAIFRAKMAFIETKLDLKPEQRPAFFIFVEQARLAGQPLRDLCRQPLPGADAHASDTLRKMQRLAAAMALTLQDLTKAVDTLEQGLGEEQAKVLAMALMPPMPPLGPHGPHLLP